jgi:hypothetical protein
MVISADDTYELEDKSRGPVQLAFDSGHRPHLGHASRISSAFKTASFLRRNGSRAGVFLDEVIAQLPVAAQKNRTFKSLKRSRWRGL